MRVIDIPLPDVAHKYLKIDDVHREGSSNRHKMVCPFPNHPGKDSNPSLILYDKTDKGQGWDYHCYVCGAHGTAPTMLTEMKIVTSEEDAYNMLRQDFGMELPSKVTLKDFAEYKGLSSDFLDAQDWKDDKRGVVIPFFDIKGDLVCEKIRVKYSGKDKYEYRKHSDSHEVHNVPYGLHWLDAYEEDVLYITEGETDCITMRQAGFPALGIMGTNGFNPDYATYLAKFKALVVVRDNDIHGWKLVTDIAEEFPSNLYMIALPKGSKDVNNYHQYRCSGDIDKFKALFETLPLLPGTPGTFITAVKENQVEPTERACWQMVGQYKRTPADLLYYKDQFAKETGVSKSVIAACLKATIAERTTEKQVDDREFLIENNCYYKTVFRGDRMVQERVSNFIIEPKYDINSDGDIIRVVDLTNAHGRVARNVHFDADALSAASKFNSRCLSAGDYIFTGTQEDLFQLCIVIFNTPKRLVHSPKRIGRLETGGWLFGNCGIDSNGSIVPIEDGLVNLDGVSYAPRSISIDDDGNTADLPAFNIGDSPLDIGQVASDFRKTFGTHGASLALGWCVAGWFSDAIYDRFGYFPYLFVTGKRSSGKSVMCTMLQAAFGFSAASAGMSIETPTNVGILRYLGYRSSLPQWYDDYRNDVRRIVQKDGLLLDVYNRHGALKGTKDGSGTVRQEKINGFLLLSGEDTPQNNALLTRCVTVTLSSWERDPSYFISAQAGMGRLRNHALQNWATAATLGKTDELFDKMAVCYNEIFRRCGDARYSGNVSIFLGAYLWAFEDVLPKTDISELLAYVYGSSALTTAEQSAEHPLSQFFNEFTELVLRGEVTTNQDFKVLDSPKRVAIRIGACHHAWGEYHRNVAPLSKKTLKGYIEKEPFYLNEERVYFDTVGQQRCMILKLADMEEEFGNFVNFVLRDNIMPEY